ncbi:porin [Gracilimonas sp.]|uniref:porin n=1 Tax=Gracilimonas sp. TaxID=1974203 RepID=UPI0028715863|nr:porin [Gracilimonas sp.]
MRKFKYQLLWVIILFIGIMPMDLTAQENSESERIDALKEMVKSESFNLGMLIQSRAVFSFDDNGTRTFSVPQARFKGTGTLDGGFSYNLHFDVADGFTLLDAQIGYAVNEQTTFTVGAQKPGISYEFLTGPHKIDFVTRSLVVTALTQNREFGAKLAGGYQSGFSYSLGIFNGNRLNQNDNNKFYYASRFAYETSINNEGNLIVGVNGSYGEQSNTSIASVSLPNIEGERIIYGGDFRFENTKVILASELLAANLEYTGFTEEDNVFGMHLTGGFKFEKSEVLARFENLNTNLLNDQERLVFGYTRYPTQQTAFRINYLLPLDDTSFSNQGLALNYQITF